MYRMLLALGMLLIVVAAADADGLPPKGSKRVVVDHKITTDSEVADYTFYTVLYGGGKGGPKVTEVKFDPKTPIEIPGAKRTGVGRQGWVVAVPKGSAAKYGTEKEFVEAVQKGKVEGMAKTFMLDSYGTLKDTDKRDTVVREHAFVKIDGKSLVLNTKKDDGAAPKDGPDDGDDPGVTAYTPRAGLWVAGAAAALSVLLGGLWAVGRTRRR